MARFISTWFYEQTADEGGLYPQVAFASHSREFFDTYRRCVGLFFAAARAAAPDARLVFFVNRPFNPLDSTVTRLLGIMLDELGVEVVYLDYSFAPPAEWQESWRNQFFVYDCLEELAQRTQPDDAVLLLDSDILMNPERSGVDALFEAIDAEGALPYILEDGNEHAIINGMNVLQMRGLGSLCGVKNWEQIQYSGGEFIACRGDVCATIAKRVRPLWRELLEHFEAGNVPCFEEAHLYSMILADLGVLDPLGNRFVRRIWTSPFGENDVRSSDAELVFWHLPAEKMTGLRREFRRLVRLGLVNWQGCYIADPLSVAQRCGVRSRTPTKAALDLMQLSWAKLSSAWRIRRARRG